MVLILVGAKAIWFSVNTALEREQLLIFTLTLPALKDYKRELTEKQTPNTPVIIFIPLFNFPPSELTFWEGETEESVLPDRGILGSRVRSKAHDSLTAVPISLREKIITICMNQTIIINDKIFIKQQSLSKFETFKQNNLIYSFR